MGRKYSSFNREEIRILKENPNTAGVTTSRLSVTLEAKKTILEFHQARWTSRRIVEELGYDPKMLGEQRMKNMVRNVRREAESKNGLHEGYLRTVGTRMSEEEIEQLECNPGSYHRLFRMMMTMKNEPKISWDAVQFSHDMSHDFRGKKLLIYEDDFFEIYKIVVKYTINGNCAGKNTQK